VKTKKINGAHHFSGADPDSNLLVLAKKKDQSAFGELVKKYHSRLSQIASKILHDQELVKDVVQETLIKAWKNLPAFRGRAAFSTWLTRIVVNTAIDLRRNNLRKRQREVQFEALPNGLDWKNFHAERSSWESETNPRKILETRELEASIMKVIGSLPEKQQEAVSLYVFEGWDYKTIARFTRTKSLTVATRIFYARQKMRARFAKS